MVIVSEYQLIENPTRGVFVRSGSSIVALAVVVR